MKIFDKLYYVGVNDYELDLFEGQYPLPHGVAYNSYVIVDEKVAIMDTVEVKFNQEWLGNIEKVLGDRKPDYLVIHHMEPDHSSSFTDFMKKYPDVMIVGNKRVMQMLGQFFPECNLENKLMEIKEGDKLNLGEMELTFYFAPMVHWPEVMMSYEAKNKVLFSADAFGKFGALDYKDEWIDEARRYYVGIIGKFGKQVQNTLNKLKDLSIKCICSLHGHILDSNVEYYLDLYNTWSSHKSEEEGVLIAYASMYGNTKKAAELLYEKLKEAKMKVEIADLARVNYLDVLPLAFKYDRLVLASPTYNTGYMPFVESFINGLTNRNISGKKIAFIENGTWAITAAKKMREAFDGTDNEFIEPVVTIKSTMTDANKEELEALKEALL